MHAQDADLGADIATAEYDLAPVDLQELTDELLDTRTAGVPTRHRLVGIEVDGRSRLANLGRHVERVVFEATFGNDAAQMTDEYGAYEAESTFFISVDREARVPTGVLRVIRNSPRGLKSLNDAASPPFNVRLEDVLAYHSIRDPAEIWDIGTVAVLSEYRRGEASVSVQLYRAMYLSALAHDIRHLVSIVDDRPLRKMVDVLGIPFVTLADSSPGAYLGSAKSHAVYGYVPFFFTEASTHMATVRGTLARTALQRLVDGSDDDSICLDV